MFCVGELAEQGEGHPDFGPYTRRQGFKFVSRNRALTARNSGEIQASHAPSCEAR